MFNKSLTLDMLGPEQLFFRDDHYGPEQKETVFWSNQNDQGEFGVFLVHAREGKIEFMRVRSPGWILVTSVKRGDYKPVKRQDVVTYYKKEVKTASNKENLTSSLNPLRVVKSFLKGII